MWKEERCLSPSSCKTTGPTRLGGTIVTSPNLKHLIKALSANTVTLGIRASTSEFLAGEGAQFSLQGRSLERGASQQPSLECKRSDPGPLPNPPTSILEPERLQAKAGRLCALNCASIRELSCKQLRLILLIKANQKCIKCYGAAHRTGQTTRSGGCAAGDSVPNHSAELPREDTWESGN